MTKSDYYLRDVWEYIIRKELWNITQTDNAVYPLKWYIDTGRASAEFLRRMYAIRPFLIGRLLVRASREHATVDETVTLIKNKIGMEDEI